MNRLQLSIHLSRLPPWTAPAALAIVAALLWSVGEGWRTDATTLRDQVQARRGEVAWMAAAAEKVRQARPAAQAIAGSEPILVVVDRTVRAFGLHAFLKQVRPEGDSAVGVSFERAPFDQALRWLHEVHSRHGMEVESLSIDRREDGVADVTLSLKRGG